MKLEESRGDNKNPQGNLGMPLLLKLVLSERPKIKSLLVNTILK